MLSYDLHMHSCRSDGSDSIERLFDLAHAAGLKTISITDHEIKPDCERMKQAAIRTGVSFIPGMEAAGVDEKTGLRAHILGYGIKDYKPVLNLTTPVIERRGRNAITQIKKLQELGYDISVEKCMNVTESPHLYRQHINYVLFRSGQIPDMFGAWYQKMYKNDGPLQMENQYPTPDALVRAISEGGGVAVLAHCGQQQNEALIPDLVKAGLKGLEISHPSNSEEYKKIIQDYAMQYSLFCTGGSDYHGEYSNTGAKVGTFGLIELPEQLKQFRIG